VNTSAVSTALKPGTLAGAMALGVGGGLLFAFGAQRISPMAAVAGIAGIGFILLLLRIPLLGLTVLAAMIPVERFGRLTDDTATFTISIMRILGMLVVFAIVASHLRNRRPVIIGTPLVLWCVCVGFALVSMTYSTDIEGGIAIASGEFGNILFLFAIANLVYADNIEELLSRARLAILVWLVSSTMMALYSIGDWHFGSGVAGGIPINEVDPQAGAQLTKYRWATVWQDTAEASLGGLPLRRSMGPTSHAAVFGINLLMSLPFFIYALRSDRFRGATRALMAVGLMASCYCILLTNTRAVMVFAALTMMLCVFWGLLQIRRWMIVGGFIGIVLVIAVMPADVFNRAFDLSNYTVANSEAIRVRLDYYQAGLRAISDHWLAGVGVGNSHVMLEYLKNPIGGRSTMHNIYLQTALDVGVFGLSVFLCFVGTLLLWANRVARVLRHVDDGDDYRLVVAIRVMMVIVLLFGLQVDVFFFPLKAWWLAAGIVIALHVRLGRPDFTAAIPINYPMARNT